MQTMKYFPFGLAGLLVAGLVLGVSGDLLFRDVGPRGINLTLWSVSVLALVVWLAPRAGVLHEYSARVPLAAAIFFSILFSWRDAEPLKLLLAGVIAGSVALTTAAAVGRSMRVAYAWDYVLDGINFGLSSAALPFSFLNRTQEVAKTQGHTLSAPVIAVLRGVLISAPLLFVFGGLLASADALFEKLITDLFDFERIASHTILTVICAWAAMTTWWLCLEINPRSPVRRSDPDRLFRWGVIEINVALGLLSLLFISFIAVQARYFFGGHEHVLKEAGLTYAEYARRGFFELAWVAAIALALLVNCARVMQAAGPLGKRMHKAVTAVIAVCVLLIIASALYKMRLYIDTYGLTRLRLYTACFMVWMATVFLWLYFTIFRERVRSFAWGMLLSGYAATFLLIAITPTTSWPRSISPEP